MVKNGKMVVGFNARMWNKLTSLGLIIRIHWQSEWRLQMAASTCSYSGLAPGNDLTILGLSYDLLILGYNWSNDYKTVLKRLKYERRL